MNHIDSILLCAATDDRDVDHVPPEDDVSLDTLQLEKRFTKLLKRIRKVADAPITFRGIMALNVDTFRRLPGIGETYVQTLVDLQTDLPEICRGPLHRENERRRIDERLQERLLHTFSLNYAELSANERPLIDAIQQESQSEVTSTTLLCLSREQYLLQPGATRPKADILAKLQHRVEVALLEANMDNTPRLLVRHSELPLEPPELEMLFIEDFERLLCALHKSEQEIALSRWGYHQEHRILRAVGEGLGITRERVRQKESEIRRAVPRSMRYAPSVLWSNMQRLLSQDIMSLFPLLRDSFATEDLTIDFLEVACNQPKGSIARHQWLEREVLPSRVMDDFFAVTPAPVELEMFVNELVSGMGMSQFKAEKCVRELERRGQAAIMSGVVTPKSLSKRAAVAHVLCGSEGGLPWNDVARVINVNEMLRESAGMKRLDWAFHDNPWVCLSGRGCYRHVQYLDETKYDRQSIFASIRASLAEWDVDQANLQAIYPSIAHDFDIDYYTLRYLTAMHGQIAGLYFVGRSGTDTVSLNDDGSSLDLSVAVLRLLESARNPLTIAEIAEQLRSKSWPLAALLCQKLMEENQVVRVDRSLYSTPKKAFRAIDIDAVADLMDVVVRKAGRPLDFDVLRERINERLQLSYSKYFYGAFAKTHADGFDWHIRRTLCSIHPIPWDGLRAAFRSVFDVSLSRAENLIALRDAVLVTDCTANGMIAGWIGTAHNNIRKVVD